MNQPQCVITGCVLVASNEEKYAYGDLHQIGKAYVFNACLNDKGQPDWYWDADYRDDAKIVSVDSNEFFEKRGVIVFNKADARLNDAATVHIAR